MRRKSILRRMSSFALGRNSILIPAGASPGTIRRLQESPSLLRRVSRVSHMSRLDGAGSPGQYRHSVGSPTIIRRIQRHRSLAEADLKRGRSGSRVAWLETGQGGSPALIRRRPSRQAQSFGAADDVARMPKLVSMPNLQVLINKELDKESSTDTNTYTDNNNKASTPNSNSNTNTTANATTTTTTASVSASAPPNPPSILATANLPAGVRRGSLPQNGVYSGGTARALSLLGASNISALNNARRNSSTQSLPNNIKHFAPPPILEESPSLEDPPLSDLSRQVSESELAVVGGFESEGGGEYEILTLPKVPLAELNLDRSRSDSDSSSSSSSSSDDDDDFRGLGSLFDSSTESTSSSTSSMDEDGSLSDRERVYYTSDEMDSDMDEVVIANIDDRTISYV